MINSTEIHINCYNNHLPILHEPQYLKIYSWEKNFDFYGMQKWLANKWTGSIYISVLYIIFIFGIKYYMTNRKPYRLTGLLTIWNLCLAIFSIMVLFRTLPEFINVITNTPNGLHNSLCHWTEHNYATAFWSFLFLCSKVVELGDTVFIVLRKQKLIFLHWYHHMMTLIAASHLAVVYEPHQIWYVVMNSFIHSFMYSYYALKSGGINVPRNWAMAITTMQIIQMILAVLVDLYAVNIKWIQGNESNCSRGDFGLKLTFTIASSYLLLFSNFFYMSYIKPMFNKNPNHLSTKKLL